MAGNFLPLIPGQELAKDFFQRAVGLGRLSHAYLFVGPEGAGKRLFARELAKALHCERGTACNDCAACSRVEHGNHQSVTVYGALEGKTSIDIDTVRALCDRTRYKTDRLEVAVLERAEGLTEPAANALLKTLEEPPGQALIILTAQSAGSLLSTIVSRCHRVYFTGAPVSSSLLSPETRAALEDSVLPGFFAGEDTKAWLRRAAPAGEDSPRAALRRLLDALVEEWRCRLASDAGPVLDDSLRRLETLLDLRRSVDRNVNPDLILERLLLVLRRGN